MRSEMLQSLDEFQIGKKKGTPPMFCKECASCFF
jgi:hypothetical protein